MSSDERSRYRQQLDRVAEGAATEIEIRRSTAEALFAVNLIGDQLLELVDAGSSVSEAIDEAMRRALDEQRYESVARRVCATAPPIASALGFPAATCSKLVDSVVAASPDELATRGEGRGHATAARCHGRATAIHRCAGRRARPGAAPARRRLPRSTTVAE